MFGLLKSQLFLSLSQDSWQPNRKYQRQKEKKKKEKRSGNNEIFLAFAFCFFGFCLDPCMIILNVKGNLEHIFFTPFENKELFIKRGYHFVTRSKDKRWVFELAFLNSFPFDEFNFNLPFCVIFFFKLRVRENISLEIVLS